MNNSIDEFWKQRHFAVVGVSRKREKFGNAVFREMKKAGYDVVPINRNTDTIDNTETYASVKDVQHQLDAAVLVIPPNETETVLHQCAERGIRYVWMQRGAESERTIALGQKLDLNIIHHECALMFIQPTRFPHTLHRWFHERMSGHHR
ncbi:MAG: CoA-binding protein [Bacteroidota bacterium]